MNRTEKLFNYPVTPKDEYLIDMLKIVLASQSPRRKKLLEQLGLVFEVIPSTTEENFTTSNPEEIVTSLASQKAEDVARKVSNSLVIGSDTIVAQNNHILGKPANAAEAHRMLSQLSGTSHTVYTGVSFAVTNGDCDIINRYSFFEETKVWFSTLTDPEIDAYIASGSPMDKAGAYGIQDDWGAVFVERIDGDYYNVVGFPLNRFYRELKNFEPSLVLGVRIPETNA